MRTRFVVGLLISAGCAASAPGSPGAPAAGPVDGGAATRGGPDAGVAAADAGPPGIYVGPDAGSPDAMVPGADAGSLALCTIPISPDLAGAEGALSTSCAGLPPIAAPPTGASDYSLGTMGGNCRGATSDGEGAVAIGLRSPASSEYQPYVDFVEEDGGVLQDETAEILAPQPSGFAILGRHADRDFGPRDQFLHFSFSNDPPALVNNSEMTLAAVPGGGALVAQFTWNLDHRFIEAVRFDEAGRQLSPPSDLVEGPAGWGSLGLAVAVGTSGEGLVAFSGSILGDPDSVYGVWVRRDGSSDRRPVRLAQPAPRLMLLRPLADGSIALRADGAWVSRTLPSGNVTPPPAWLAALANRDVLLRRSGKGYVVPTSGPRGGDGCAPLLELRAPAGNLCAELGTRDRNAFAELGLDGTLFATFFGSPCDFGLCCHVRWWKGALP